MDLLTPSPLRAASLLWRPRPGAWSRTVIFKATFALVAGTCPLAAEQEAPNDEDTHWDDDPARSLSAASDVVPFKSGAEVLLVGYAYAPERLPARSVVARLVVEEVDKSIEIWGDRWWTAVGAVREGARFTRMPLRYERAAGGPGTENPVGVRPDGPVDKNGLVPLPNMQPPGIAPAPGEPILPVGFGPIAPTWPLRALLGPHAAKWSRNDWSSEPLPDDIDGETFNAAPVDQQMERLHEDAVILLENLHPDHPVLETRLPGVRPRVTIERPGRKPEELPVRCDTLWIDTDRLICALTWRGTIELANADERLRVVVSMDEGAVRQDRDQLARAALSPEPSAETDTTTEAETGRLPAFRPPQDEVGGTMFLAPEEVPRPVPPPPAAPVAAVPSLVGATTILLEGPSLPQVVDGTLPAPPAAVPPPLVTAPAAAMLAIRPEPGAPPRLGAMVPLGPGARLGSIAEISGMAAGVHGRQQDARQPAPLEALPRTASKRHAPREPIELLWLDAAYAPRVRRQPNWKIVLAELELEELDRKLERSLSGDTEEHEGQGSQQDTERRNVVEIFARGDPTAPVRVQDALDPTASEDSAGEAPLVLVAGDLHFQFDEIESLKAAVAAVAPMLPAADKRLKDATDAGAAILESRWPESARSLAGSAVARIRKAFAETRKELPADHVDETIERAVVQGRHYQRRIVFGQKWLRTFLHAGKSTQDALLVYLPESLANELPMFPEMRARIIAEVRSKQDKYEAQPVALRAVAVGRVA